MGLKPKCVVSVYSIQTIQSVVRGVKIYKIKDLIPGSDFTVLANGTVKEKKGKYITTYCYPGGYHESNVTECILSIHRLWKLFSTKYGTTKVDFASIMNEGDV